VVGMEGGESAVVGRWVVKENGGKRVGGRGRYGE